MEYQDKLSDKKKEIVRICLKVFIQKGLLNTTSRELSAAINLQNAGIYYYFKSKEDLVIACAEEAAIQLEDTLIPLQENLDNLDELTLNLKRKCDENAATMKFLAQVFTVEKYSEQLKSVLSNMAKRYKKYAEIFAEKLCVNVNEIEPYIYMCITAATDYMIFGDITYIKPQFELLKKQIKSYEKE